VLHGRLLRLRRRAQRLAVPCKQGTDAAADAARRDGPTEAGLLRGSGRGLHRLPAPPAVPAELTPDFGDGTYVVGTNIVPGTYETTGPAAGGIGTCSWSRLKDTSGDFGSIIATDVRQGPTAVTISKTDGAFVTAGCNNWHKVVSLDPRPPGG